EGIAKFLENDSSVLSADGSSIIDKVNYLQNKTIIDRLSVFIESAKKLGLAVSVLFAIIAALVTFNTIRLAIYTAKDEISVMKLVGASNWYIRSPFIVSGVFSGFISAVMAMIILYPATLWVGSATRNFFGGLDLFGYYINHLLNLSVVLIVSGILLGAISSYLAVRKYLRH
ncbi:MAG: FtsX-like permease family protein, partial [Candidatus Paceibacterota bacterium]